MRLLFLLLLPTLTPALPLTLHYSARQLNQPGTTYCWETNCQQNADCNHGTWADGYCGNCNSAGVCSNVDNGGGNGGGGAQANSQPSGFLGYCFLASCKR